VILRLHAPPDHHRELDGLILEEAAYAPGVPRATAPEPSLTLVLDGLVVEERGQEVCACQPLSVIVHPAGGQGILRRSGSPGWARCFEMRLGGGWVDRLRECGLPQGGPPTVITGGRVNTLMAQIHVETVRPAPASAMAIGGLTLTLLAELRRYTAASSGGPPMTGWLRRAVALVHERYRGQVRMADIAREVGVHPVHLSRGFRRAFGLTMTDYVRDLRVHFAAEALVASPDPLPRIARSAGYQNVGHFTRSFKRATGMTPAAYRGRNGRSLGRASGQ